MVKGVYKFLLVIQGVHESVLNYGGICNFIV